MINIIAFCKVLIVTAVARFHANFYIPVPNVGLLSDEQI